MVEKNKKLTRNRTRVDMPFGKNLKSILEERDLTLRAAAEIAGVEVSVIHNWISGSMPGNPLHLQRLCRALSVDFEWMITGSSSNRQIQEASLNELFDESDLFDGLVRLKATKLNRKKST